MVKWVQGDTPIKGPTQTQLLVDMPPNTHPDVQAQIVSAAQQLVTESSGVISRNYLAAKQNNELSGLSQQRVQHQIPGGDMSTLFSSGSETVQLRMKPKLTKEKPTSGGKQSYTTPIWWQEMGWKYDFYNYPSGRMFKESFFTSELSMNPKIRGVRFGGPGFISQFKLVHPDGVYYEYDEGFGGSSEIVLSPAKYDNYYALYRVFTPGSYEVTVGGKHNYGDLTGFQIVQMVSVTGKYHKTLENLMPGTGEFDPLYVLGAFQHHAREHAGYDPFDTVDIAGTSYPAKDDLAQYYVYYFKDSDPGAPPIYGTAPLIDLEPRYKAFGEDKRSFTIGSPTWIWIAGIVPGEQRQGTFTTFECKGTRVPMMYATFEW